jgi:hypothetical protein
MKTSNKQKQTIKPKPSQISTNSSKYRQHRSSEILLQGHVLGKEMSMECQISFLFLWTKLLVNSGSNQ